ncbi:hypothetical protein CYY_000147 [Polysphondylium violaceum]|uniref:Glutamine amidotransferase domain-containing protein n=1 Tax=Polysphondylium violaceum TaxID=133409 RepID=A0A8J4Q562_9MYCE|nr:hypothetical protein CYY_000147 [Polysphondylium violaceum]
MSKIVDKTLRIGLLKCDTFIPEVRNKFGDIDVQFRNLLNQNTINANVDLNVFEIASENRFPDKKDITSNHYNGFIITGSRSSVNDDNEWTNTLKDYIRFFSNNNIKTVGICFGHQAIATALGGEVTMNDKGWMVSDHSFKIKDSLQSNNNYSKIHKSLSPKDDSTINIICSNKQIVSKIPQGFEIIGGSDICPNHSMIKDNQFLSFQGHPEYTPNLIKTIIQTRRGLIPDDVIEDGIKRADNSKIDQSTYANTILNFFLNKDV